MIGQRNVVLVLQQNYYKEVERVNFTWCICFSILLIVRRGIEGGFSKALFFVVYAFPKQIH